MSNNSRSNNGGRRGGKKKNSSSRGSGKNSVPFGRPKVDPYVTYGHAVKTFLSDQRLVDQKFTFSVTKEGHFVYRFQFSEKDPQTLSLSDYDMTKDEYVAWRAKRVRRNNITNEQTQWTAFLMKVHLRTCITSYNFDLKDHRFSREAKSLLLSVLSPVEKGIYNLSQKQFAQHDAERLKLLLEPTSEVLAVKKMDEARQSYVRARLDGDSSHENPCPQSFWIENGIMSIPTQEIMSRIKPVSGRDTQIAAADAEQVVTGSANTASSSSSPKSSKKKKGLPGFP